MTMPLWKATARTTLKYAAHVLRAKLGGAGEFALSIRTGTGAPRYFLTAMIRIKNEARFLPELLAYHRLLGVEHFWLYDNNSTDAPEQVLAPFIDAGLVTLVKWPDVPATPSCYRHFMAEYGHSSQWVAFLDADEYLVEAGDGLLVRTLRERAAWPALALNWRYFGSSGHETIPEGLLIEAFTRCGAGDDSHVKVIAQPARIRACVTPHSFVYRGPGLARSPAGRIVAGSRNPGGAGANLRINHYVYRSRENYLAKTGQGFADREGFKAQMRSAGKADLEFGKHNAAEDPSLGRRYGARVRDALRQMGYGAPFVADPA